VLRLPGKYSYWNQVLELTDSLVTLLKSWIKCRALGASLELMNPPVTAFQVVGITSICYTHLWSENFSIVFLTFSDKGCTFCIYRFHI
jgi:hypothetical protein